MDWRAKVKTAPYWFYLEVPHLVAGVEAGHHMNTLTTGTSSPESQEPHLRALDILEEMEGDKKHGGVSKPKPVVKRGSVVTHFDSDNNAAVTDDEGNIVRVQTYAQLVQNALDLLHAQRKISKPIWCKHVPHMVPIVNREGEGKSDEIKSHTESEMEAERSMISFTSSYPELVKHQLSINIGIGTQVGTLNMIPVTVAKVAIDPDEVDELEPEVVSTHPFWDSVKSRLVVEQVVVKVRAAADFTFDYLNLVLVAATLAAVGLASNNTVVIVASMLVSPIMGPILAITFGLMIENKQLWKDGLRNELISLFICIMVGFVSGILMVALGVHREFSWPTNEMHSRGQMSGIYLGIAIATPSGFGVALSVLSDNTASLVGVAISASLLPPAVNSGVCWAYACMLYVYEDLSVSPAQELAIEGFISLMLTILNIVIIIITACFMFWIKSVVKYDGEGADWQDDLRVYKASRAVVRNDAAGKSLADKARAAAKILGLKNQKSKIRSAVSCCRCGACCNTGSHVQPPTTEPVAPIPNPGAKVSEPASRRPTGSVIVPDVLSLFEPPSAPIETHEVIASPETVHVHRSLHRMLSNPNMRQPPTRNSALRSASQMASTTIHRRRRSRNRIDERNIEAASKTVDTLRVLAGHGHTRQLTHAQYQDISRMFSENSRHAAIDTLFSPP